LLRLETNSPAVWFKAVCEPFRREYAVTKHIAAHTPGVSPDVLSTSDEWRAWLILEAEGCPLGNCHRLEAWVQAARKLATVQRGYVRATEKLLALGAIDYRGAIVIEKLDELCRRLPELMSRQPAGSRAPRLGPDELEALRYHVPLLCEAFFAVYIPMTLVHGDPNADNFIIGPRGATILDWAESYVSHPFLSYEYLRMHLNRTQPLEAREWELELGDAYAQVWRPLLAERDIQDAFALVRLVAPLLVASRSLDRLEASREIPLLEAHIRSLARVAFRALQPLLVEVTA
jgi:hypothetical protein